MKIGVFDSGLGGLIILKNIAKKLPQYDYVYLGDTAHMPYGNRTQAEIFKFTKQAMEFLFAHDCSLVIIACNTSSSRALRKLQREFLPKKYPDKKILGVIIPTVEAAAASVSHKRIAVMATLATVNSKAYIKELKKIAPKTKVSQKAAPELATAIEFESLAKIRSLTKGYLDPLIKNQPSTLILGCTHYSVIKPLIKKMLPKNVKLIDQADVIPYKLKEYLNKHLEIRKKLTSGKRRELFVTQKTQHNTKLAKKWLGKSTKLKLVSIK